MSWKNNLKILRRSGYTLIILHIIFIGEKYEEPDKGVELDDKKEIMSLLFKSLYFHCISHCESLGLLKRQMEFTEFGLTKNQDINGNFRIHSIHIQNHFLIGDLDGAKKAIDRAFEQFPDLPTLVVCNYIGLVLYLFYTKFIIAFWCYYYDFSFTKD